MTSHTPHLRPIAARDAGAAGAMWLDSGITLGLVVVDANRPAPGASPRPADHAGIAVAQRKPFVTTH